MLILSENDKQEFKEDTINSKEIQLETDNFFCSKCKQVNQKSQKTFYCIHCGNRFPVDRNNQLILDENNFSMKYRNDMKKIIPKKKKKKWRLLSGFTVSFGTYLAVTLVSLILFFIFSVFTNVELDSILFSFLISISSLLFFIIPILWIQRYYPRILTMKQRFSELGIPLERYSRKQLIREILLGFLLGLISVFLVILLQLISYYLIKLLFHVDFYNFLEAIQFEDFALTIPDNIFELSLFILMMTFLIGFPEEIMFRGFVQRSFENSLKKPAALLLTAVYFAFFHIFLYILQPIIFFFMVIPYLGLSILLGLIRNWRGDIIATIIAHIIYNCTQTFIIFLILNSI
ncbi:lysostaphin resistance A-like protein [Promethearchaeum syntrophicum]|uniref:Lysostaphin resistance A-like protein n=1 Tax=Promethearchaeum syntrophicum TaxID=2594042 RepID=A0A5B9D5I1_9ARCH|nr:type II CAAX endopeptidase family protein [Candidatus Prometheoarchaeum syntrophicum]QEE14223.1 CAAX amino terminal protease self- immunity [Candidatus Prometheoarchaeum syntrophicum]